MRLRSIGGFLAVDGDGLLVSAARASLILPPWKDAVDDVSLTFKSQLKGLLHSVYVRGSVACGLAIAGISDIDMFAVVQSSGEHVDLSWRPGYLDLAEAHYSFATHIEAKVYRMHRVLFEPGYQYLRFLLKTQSVCVLGIDLSLQIAPYRPDRSIMFHADRLRTDLPKAKARLRDDTYDAKEVCRWIAKALLRSAFELVIEREKRYTRDLYLCYEVFATHFPEREVDARRCLELALDPRYDAVGEVCVLLDDFGDWLVARINCALPSSVL
jgi:uncharacterized protein